MMIRGGDGEHYLEWIGAGLLLKTAIGRLAFWIAAVLFLCALG